MILSGDGEGEYTISTSALALLRTLEIGSLARAIGRAGGRSSHQKTFADDYEQQLYEEFWHEYDGRLSRALPLAERRVQGQQ